MYLTYYNLFIAQDLWQVHYQIFSIIFLKEFIELHVNSDMMIKNVKHVELNIQLLLLFPWIYELLEYQHLCCKKNCQDKLDEELKEQFFNTFKNFLTMITISSFYCCKKVFFLLKIWMIGKNSMKHHYLKNKIFTVT